MRVFYPQNTSLDFLNDEKIRTQQTCLLLTLPTQKEMLFVIVWNKQMLSKYINIISDVIESSASDCIALCKKKIIEVFFIKLFDISLIFFNNMKK